MSEKRVVIKVPVIESERGWGMKVDDYMLCLSMEDAEAFREMYNANNNLDVTPDWYMFASDDFSPMDVTKEEYDFVVEGPNNRAYKSNLDKRNE